MTDPAPEPPRKRKYLNGYELIETPWPREAPPLSDEQAVLLALRYAVTRYGARA